MFGVIIRRYFRHDPLFYVGGILDYNSHKYEGSCHNGKEQYDEKN
jgi:hypothetical protein